MTDQSQPRRYALSGLGHRATTTYLPLLTPACVGGQAPIGDLVAVVDADPARLQAFAHSWPAPVELYLARDFDAMLSRLQPDEVLLAGPDHTHAPQITAALAHSVDVWSEKPMVTTAAEALHVLRCESASTARVRVGHNLRHHPGLRTVHQLLQQGVIGTVRSVRLDYHLTPGHGASYLRRWHRLRRNSGGLEVTKSCHHLDLLTWWLGQYPVEVRAMTGRQFYAGGVDSVPADADIDDTVHALIRYTGGAMAVYTLTGCSPWEGLQLTVHGDRGALRTSYPKAPSPGSAAARAQRITITDLQGRGRYVDVSREDGRHGGADQRMAQAAFGPGGGDCASSRDGAAAVLLGTAITASALTGRAVPVTPLPADGALPGPRVPAPSPQGVA